MDIGFDENVSNMAAVRSMHRSRRFMILRTETHPALRQHLLPMSLAVALVACSVLVCNRAIQFEPFPVGPWVKLAAVGLVVSWSHYLVWLFQKMRRHEISAGYVTILFWGAIGAIFLGYKCLF
jgi:hypothetical protein